VRVGHDTFVKDDTFLDVSSPVLDLADQRFFCGSASSSRLFVRESPLFCTNLCQRYIRVVRVAILWFTGRTHNGFCCSQRRPSPAIIGSFVPWRRGGPCFLLGNSSLTLKGEDKGRHDRLRGGRCHLVGSPKLFGIAWEQIHSSSFTFTSFDWLSALFFPSRGGTSDMDAAAGRDFSEVGNVVGVLVEFTVEQRKR
jgi:hypothetical protein